MQRRLDQLIAALVATTVLGSALGFGGSVWWSRPALAVVVGLLVLAWLARAAVVGRLTFFKSPLAWLGLMSLGLAAAQLAPLPPALAARLSPRARAAHTLGMAPDRTPSDDLGDSRTPATLDRSATLRWLVGASGVLAVFCVAAGFTDRLGRAAIIWGSVVAALFVNTAIIGVQLLSQSTGLYASIEPGRGPAWGPSLADLLAAPGESSVLDLAAEPSGPEGTGWAVARPIQPDLLGTMMGGPGAFLALGALALPLALGSSLHLLAPRGGREPIWPRLRSNGRGGLFSVLYIGTLASALIVGVLAGSWLSLPFGLGLLIVGLVPSRKAGLRWWGGGLTFAALLMLGLGVALGERFGPTERTTWPAAVEVWRDAGRIARDFPAVGSGLGSFAAVHPYYKSTDQSPTTAGSSLAQWSAESGLAGLVLLGSAGLWCLVRLVGAIRRVGSADRVLAFTLVGALTCFVAVSAVHWTVELAAVALAFAAVAGTGHRWLAGGTDLFVERA